MSEKLNLEGNTPLEVNTGAETTQPKVSKLGIRKDLEAKAGIPVSTAKRLDSNNPQYPTGYEFPLVKLVNVVFTPNKEVGQDKVPTPVIAFVFKGEGDKQFTGMEFPLDYEDAKFDMKLEALQKRLRHIFDETIGTDKFVEGSMDGDTFAELFENVAKAFNAVTITKGEGDAAKTVKLYAEGTHYFKVIYYQTRLQIPMFPNFIQRAKIGNSVVPCELRIVVGTDELEPKAKAKASGFNAGGGDLGGGGFNVGNMGMDSFPDISNL